jgi:hypothetical protein
MNSEFDFDQEDLGFGEAFTNDFQELDGFEAEKIQMRTAILSKNNMIALLCVKTAHEGGAICRIDPREAQPAVQIYDSPEGAIEWFNKSLRTSCKNGWKIVYDGMPLQG